MVCLVPTPPVYVNRNLSTLRTYMAFGHNTGTFQIHKIIGTWLYHVGICEEDSQNPLVRRFSCWPDTVSIRVGGTHTAKNWVGLWELKATFSQQLASNWYPQFYNNHWILLPTTEGVWMWIFSQSNFWGHCVPCWRMDCRSETLKQRTQQNCPQIALPPKLRAIRNEWCSRPLSLWCYFFARR